MRRDGVGGYEWPPRQRGRRPYRRPGPRNQSTRCPRTGVCAAAARGGRARGRVGDAAAAVDERQREEGKRETGKAEKGKGEAGNGKHGITTCMPSVVWPFLKRRWHTVRRRWPAHQRPRQTGGRLWTEHLASRRCSSSSSNSSLGDAAEAVEERQREAGKRETGRAEAGKGKSGKGGNEAAAVVAEEKTAAKKPPAQQEQQAAREDAATGTARAATGTARPARAASGSSSGVRRGAGQGGRVGHHDNDEREHANAPILLYQLYMFYYILGRVGFFWAG